MCFAASFDCVWYCMVLYICLRSVYVSPETYSLFKRWNDWFCCYINISFLSSIIYLARRNVGRCRTPPK